MIEDWAELAARLTAAAESARGRALCTALPLASAAAEARSWMAQVAEVAALLRAGRTPPALAAPEIEPALVAAEKQIVLGAEELRPVALLCGIATAARAFWGAYAESAPEVAKLARELAPPDDLAHTIGETFDGSGEIRDTASYELARLRSERQQVAGHARATIEALIRDDNFAPVLQDEYFTIRSDRYVLPLKASAKSMGLGIVHDTSRTGETVFVEPTALVGANNRLKVLELDIRRESRRILEAVTMEVAIAAKALRRTAETLALLDARTAGGRLAVGYGGNAITIADEREAPSLQLNQLRHPLLALARGADSGKVISNDVALGGAAAQILVVSGPNAGGKTVLMKAIGMAAQMARAGLLVAAAPNSRVAFFDAVLTDIGDNQSVLGDLSTFSGHLGNLVRILDGSRTGTTLVLLDELMAGTNPDQGAALARATAEALADRLDGNPGRVPWTSRDDSAGQGPAPSRRRALAVITTHYDSLKALGEGDARFANAGMEYDLDHLQPTFRLIVGAPGRSYAFDIAARMGMPAAILQRARDLAGAPSVSLESVIARLEAREASLAKEAERLADATAEATATADAQRTAAEALERRERELGRHAREAVEEAVAEAREALRAIVREAQAANTSRAAEAARTAVTRAAEDAKARMTLPDAEPEARPPAPRLEVGARVFVERLGQTGVLAQTPDARGRAKVTIGAITLEVSSHELRAAPAGAAKARAQQQRRPASEPAAPSGDDPLALVSPSGGHTLDVRGRDGDDAVAELEAYLDRAALSGQSHLIVVHGHGTGALRKRVRAYLDDSPYVARWAPGTPRQGGDGASVVELR